MRMDGEGNRVDGQGHPYSPSYVPPQPNMMFSLGSLSGGKARPRKASNGVSPVVDPNATGTQAGNTGFERFIALDRGRRGGRVIKAGGKAGAHYKSGPYKGMTEGQVDLQAERRWQSVPEGVRDRFRKMNQGDHAAARGRAFQSAQDQFDLARRFQEQIRADQAAEEERKNPSSNGGGGTSTPDFDPSKKSPVTPPPSESPQKNPNQKGDLMVDKLPVDGGSIGGMPAEQVNASMRKRAEKEEASREAIAANAEQLKTDFIDEYGKTKPVGKKPMAAPYNVPMTLPDAKKDPKVPELATAMKKAKDEENLAKRRNERRDRLGGGRSPLTAGL